MFGFCKEDSIEAETLHTKLLNFYNTTEDYSAFAEPSYHPQFWSAIKQKVQTVIARKGKCVLLEIGAGKSDFGTFLEGLRSQTVFCVQDITNANEDHLKKVADRVYIGGLESLEDTFDVIFASFVLEHLTRPRHTIDHLIAHLNHSGSLFLLNPRYDFPFYLSPSCKHRPALMRFLIGLWLQFRRLNVLMGAAPDFLLDGDPSVFHRPWFRDADAIHWVSLWDLKRQIPKSCRLSRVPLNYAGWRGSLWERWCLLSVEIAKIEI
jgi:hypothetical protein